MIGSPFTPARRRGTEILDDPNVDPTVRARSIADVSRSNTLFGGRRAAVSDIGSALGVSERHVGQSTTLLDVGTGRGDISVAAAIAAERSGIALHTIGFDTAESLLREIRPRLTHTVCGDALALPFASHSVDIVLCSQLLHHFAEGDCVRLIAELDRVARQRVIIADLRRSWLAASGFWMASWALRFHAVTRHDGFVSVMRGFTAAELRALVERATGAPPTIRRRLGYRLTASWIPQHRGTA